MKLPRHLIDPPVEYEKREAIKRSVHAQLAALPAEAVEARVKNLIVLIAMWYQRNRRSCPSFETYIAHFLSAPSRLVLDKFCGSAVVADRLIERFGTVARPYIASSDKGVFSDFNRPKRSRK